MKNSKTKHFFGILIFLAVFAAAAIIVMLLWNWLVPSVIGWAVINYWQAAGLLLLCKLLFGGFGKMGHGFHPGHMGHSRKAKARMYEMMKNMSIDERRAYIRSHMFGGNHMFGDSCGKREDGEQQ